MSDSPLKIGVLISGSGSNLEAIVQRIEAGDLNASVELVVSSRQDAYGLVRAEKHGIDALVVPKELYKNPLEADAFIASELLARDVEYVIMAGYMRMVHAPLLEVFPNRVVNLHPALLPSFKGAHAIQEAFDAGVKVSGITVHFANEDYDCGPIIAQHPVEILEGMTLDEFETAIHAAEHELYPEVISWLSEDRVSVDVDGKVHIA